MEYFASNLKHNLNKVKTYTEEEGKRVLFNIVKQQIDKNERYLGFDIEATGLDAYECQPLLYGFGNRENTVIFDYSIDVDGIFKYLLAEGFTFIGHNLKYDTKVVKVHNNCMYHLLWDTMIAECRIAQNTGYSYSFESVLDRRLNVLLEEIGKDVRNDFIGNRNMIFEDKHILYLDQDIKYLFPLKEKQEEKIKEYGMEFLLYEIEFPLVSILGEGELNGVDINVPLWKENVANQKKKRYDLACQLDSELIRLRDNLILPDIHKKLIKGGKYDRDRVEYYYEEQTDLFGNPCNISDSVKGSRKKAPKVVENSGNTNWASTEFIVWLLGVLKLPCPTDKDNYIIPILNPDNPFKVLPLPGDKYGNPERFSTKKTVLEAFLLANTEIEHYNLLDLLTKYRNANSMINTYGLSFLENRNKVSGMFHTIYMQAHSANSRFRSGGGKKDPDKFNGQNIPRDKEYREAFFYKEGYRIATIDLSGAEVTIMADKANDRRLFNLSNEDIHSHMATQGWRNIFLYRAGKILRLWKTPEAFFKLKDGYIELNTINNSTNAKIKKLYELSKNYIISKTENAKKRQPAKNLTFGSVYGAGASRAGKTINVTTEEGAVYIGTIKQEIPDTFKFVEKCTREALTNGYLINNTRTNSRSWFMPVLMKHHYNVDYSKNDLSDIKGQSRNLTISGTQADMIKEMMVVIGTKARKENWDLKFLLQVHDELVYAYPITPEYDFMFDYLKTTMTETANKYLHHMKMKADGEEKLTWTK